MTTEKLSHHVLSLLVHNVSLEYGTYYVFGFTITYFILTGSGLREETTVNLEQCINGTIIIRSTINFV